MRSVTPSDGGSVNGSGKKDNDDVLRSPLAKRKKVAAERTGFSRLKDSISADDLTGVDVEMRDENDDEDEDEGEDEEDEEDDFLARELEEELG